MIGRASQLFLPTLREAPADAEAVSHKLLVRGGFIRQVAAGVWTYLPLGWRVHRKIEQIIREEMDGIGCQELLMPVLTPLELWQLSKRDFIDELFRLKDRKGADYVLPLTHEETVTFHARELQSYRQLPQMLYHFAIKERDEPRPRSGLIRVREFIMKDAYSFDRDEAGLDDSFDKQHGAYVRIFERCGLLTHDVAAEPGMMGGSESRDFLAPAGAGENTLVTCENGDFSADIEVATTRPRPPVLPERLDAPQEVETPGVTTIEGLADLLGIDASATSKAMPHVKLDGTVRLRGAPLARGRRPDPRRVRRLRRVARPRRLHRRGRCGLRSPGGAVRRRRQPGRVAPAGCRGRARLHAALRRPAHLGADGRLPDLRRRAPVRDGDRGRPHLQARHAVLGAARRHLPRRGRRPEAAGHGLVRDRPGPGHGRRSRAAP